MGSNNSTYRKKSRTCGEGGYISEFSFGIYWWTLKNPKNHNCEKIIKNCWRYHHFYTYVPRTKIFTWGTVPAILSEINYFYHFGPFFALYPPLTIQKTKNLKASGDAIILNFSNKKHNQMMYAYSDMECGRHNCWSF